MAKTWSNSFSPPIVESIRLIVTAGAISGSTTWRKRCQRPAPSSAAASSSSRGTPCSPARKITIE
jgi:hypothetical protein